MVTSKICISGRLGRGLVEETMRNFSFYSRQFSCCLILFFIVGMHGFYNSFLKKERKTVGMSFKLWKKGHRDKYLYNFKQLKLHGLFALAPLR